MGIFYVEIEFPTEILMYQPLQAIYLVALYEFLFGRISSENVEEFITKLNSNTLYYRQSYSFVCVFFLSWNFSGNNECDYDVRFTSRNWHQTIIQQNTIPFYSTRVCVYLLLLLFLSQSFE